MKIFQSIVCGLLLVVLAGGCMKNDSPDVCNYDPCSLVAPASEVAAVQNYLTTNNIAGATQHCSGVFYIIDAPGTGATPGICSMVNTNYVGKLTNGNVFDQGSFQRPIQLGGLIRGWANTLPLIKQGGKLRIYVPPTLGYGSQAAGSIPPNSILIFDIELTSVQ